MTPSHAPPPWPSQPPPPKKGFGAGCIIAIILVVVVGLPVIGIVATLGIYGVRKYIANAKTAEARNALGQIGKAALVAYEGSASTSGSGKRRICPSASRPVPIDPADIRGKKYQSQHSDWDADRVAGAGFSCLGFEMTAPQYFQYSYEANATGFIARARGDLNGDGVLSTFELKGQIAGDSLVVAPSIYEIDSAE